ncbi:hypothetical protein NQ318_002379 [Aromia moschata]|uniref:Uncharacterized protein n=1 Tax=Aromia moschata TaxID=1265417 RepID=A0AAV8YHL1_9CUCU|nr:hypothetical protein NQ318_002379 [Aromia moschata]
MTPELKWIQEKIEETFIWRRFANNITYYGLSWNTNNLAGNRYLNFVISGAVEIPAYTFLILTLNRWGRKKLCVADYEGVPKNNRNRVVVGGACIVRISAARRVERNSLPVQCRLCCRPGFFCSSAFARFKNGDMSIDDKPHSGGPSTARKDENVEKIRELVLTDRRQIIDHLSEITNFNRRFGNEKGCCQVCSPRALTDNQKACRVETCRALKQQLETDPDFLSKVITGDESWCYGYDPETKSSQWKRPLSPRPKKCRQVKSNIKTMLIFFFDAKGVHSEFVPPGQTVNQTFYLEVLRRLRNTQQWLVVVLAMIGKLAITASYGAVYIFSTEQFPTVIRNAGLGAGSTCARLGSIIAPYINITTHVWTPLPLLIFGSLSFIGGILSLVLPETLNKKLPETMEEGEEFGRKPESGSDENQEEKLNSVRSEDNVQLPKEIENSESSDHT